MTLHLRLAALFTFVAMGSCDAASKPAPQPDPAPAAGSSKEAHNWTSWRGPFQTGVSLEHYKDAKINKTPAWVVDLKGRGTPVICDGKVFIWGYRGEGPELEEVLACVDAQTGKTLWEHEFRDFLSDTIYDRYTIGSPAVDPETKRVYLHTHYGFFLCYDFEGKEQFRVSMMEDFGRLSFPNARVGTTVIEGDLAILHCISSNWGADGPGADRTYAFDKMTGELVWWSRPGIIPPVDSSFSTPVIETRYGKRVLYLGTGCGNIVCVNARDGKALWRFQGCKNGINTTPLIHKGKIIFTHGDENVDSTEKGRMTAIKIPDALPPPAETPGETAQLPRDAEVWRNPIGSSNGSPLLVGDRVYQLDDTGVLNAVNADTGEILWSKKMATANIHASLSYVDGLIYATLLDGRLAVLKPGDKDAEIVTEIKIDDGNCLGAAVVLNGQLFVHTTKKFYCFTIENKGITRDAAPVAEIPKAGKPAALQIIPAEVLLTPGSSAKFRIRSVDANGFTVANVDKAAWESFIPPTAKVKASMDAKINDAGELVASKEAHLSAGAFKATAEGGITGTIRGRVLQNLPISMNFDGTQLTEEFPKDDHGNPPYKFAYPPLPWIGARFKFQVMDKDGQMVFGKSFDRMLFQRATTFIAPSNLSNYTMQVDGLTEGSARVKSDIGVIHQRYMIVLRGNAGQLEVSSNMERLKEVVPFKMIANTWYTLKSRVDANPDGSGVVRAKAWAKGQPEPEAWTIEVKVAKLHQNGAPGLFSFTPLNQKRAYLDNVSVTPNTK
jgi:outer membrane protein assembly factor BamB